MREELEHRAATHCRERLASFETAEKKLHHCHGTGQYLGALCHSCNIAAQTPKTTPVVFHNEGGYDLLRTTWRETPRPARWPATGRGRPPSRTACAALQTALRRQRTS